MGASVVVLAECSNAIHGDESKSLVFEGEAIGLSNEQWQRVYQGLDKLSELAANTGIPAVYHHHMGTVIQSGNLSMPSWTIPRISSCSSIPGI